MIKRHTLTDGWRLTAVSGLEHIPADLKERLADTGVEARTPGCVHTDLIAAGLMPDPFIGLNDQEQAWIGRVDWCYENSIEVTNAMLNAGRLDLMCEGLDTIAEVSVNGELIGASESMFIPLRIGLRDVAKPGENLLKITFRSPLHYAEKMLDRLGNLPHCGGGSNPIRPYNMIRKMACNFGWDWGPAMITSGIWKPIRIEAWSTARLGDVRPLVTRADHKLAEVQLHIPTHVDDSPPADVVAQVTLSAPDGKRLTKRTKPIGAGTEVSLTLEVESPKRWYPAGYGEQPLYTLCVQLADTDGQVIDTVEKMIGLREARLVTDPDSDGNGESFYIEVNGERVYCKGANWIPDDTFLHRVTPERYRERITQAKDANMNMLRVWGGGIYESDDFYDVCDELGILVWQDLLTACALYPEESPFDELFEAELRHHIPRLSSHPSLVLWNGGNECIWAAFDWGDEWERLRNQDERGWGLGYWLDRFPRVINELDPTRAYWANSPFSGSIDITPNDETRGNCHLWDVWNGHGEYENYLKHRSRFASEFGFQGPPTWPTLDGSIAVHDRRWDSPGMHNHNKQEGGQQRADTLIDAYFSKPDNFDDWLYLAQLNQARALTLGCEWFRALSPHNSGALYWQLNDCWPVTSWATIDAGGRPRPAWFATKRFFRNRLITILPSDHDPANGLAVYMHNDHAEAWSGVCTVRRITLEGETLDSLEQTVDIAPRGSQGITLPDRLAAPTDAILVAEIGGDRVVWFTQRDKDIDYPWPSFEAETAPADDGLILTITARTLLRDLTIYPDRLDPEASIDDQGLTLLPGDTRSFLINTRKEMSAEALTTRPVMQVANSFGRCRIEQAIGSTEND